jgi:hypothetical protein
LLLDPAIETDTPWWPPASSQAHTDEPMKTGTD